ALLAKEHGSVLLLTKGTIEDCNTRYAQGGIAAAVGPTDSPELHLQDTLEAGAGLCHQEVVSILAREGPQAIEELVNLGVGFDTAHGEVLLAQEGAHSVPRVLHAGGDATGANIEMALANQVRSSRIKVLEHTMVTKIEVQESGRATGVEVLDCKTGQQEHFPSNAIIVATGGAGQLFRSTTNPAVATGDGVALAFRAGAAVMDMEFYQFHPTALRLSGASSFLISEAVRGEGGVLRTPDGKPFMKGYHPLAELAPRDIVARAIVEEMARSSSDHVLLDVTHLPPSRVATRFPTIYRSCLSHGLDITRNPIPVAPAAHYMIGGVKTNSWGETTLPGLYACGETAATGVHGANRLASNSLLETVVFGKRVVERVLGRNHEDVSSTRPERQFKLPQRHVPCASIPPMDLATLQDIMCGNAGIVRNGEGLLWAARILNVWSQLPPEKNDRPSHELANMVLLGRLLVEGALLRQESRGVHYRVDYPNPAPEWQTHTIFTG
ncbi:MAG: L-aspartate oxidase, partial [Chloroflexi bacterium]|nr:L-aspartate oxidase [Chloroflexota bacterium]